MNQLSASACVYFLLCMTNLLVAENVNKTEVKPQKKLPACDFGYLRDEAKKCANKILDPELIDDPIVSKMTDVSYNYDPIFFFREEQYCKNVKMFAPYLECVFTNQRMCNKAHNKTDMLAPKGKVNEAFTEMCFMQDQLFKKVNRSDVLSCLSTSQAAVQGCVNQYDEITTGTNIEVFCSDYHYFEKCIKKTDNCTGGVAVFSTWTETMSPLTCRSPALPTVAVLLLLVCLLINIQIE